MGEEMGQKVSAIHVKEDTGGVSMEKGAKQLRGTRS
jgi:hypothetical protein